MLEELRNMADRPHVIINEVDREERRVYYNVGRDENGDPLETRSVTYKTIRNLVLEIKARKKLNLPRPG